MQTPDDSPACFAYPTLRPLYRQKSVNAVDESAFGDDEPPRSFTNLRANGVRLATWLFAVPWGTTTATAQIDLAIELSEERPRGLEPIHALLALVAVLLLPFASLGCGGDRSGLLQDLGILDPPPSEPVEFIVLCDPSRGGACTPKVLAATLRARLRRAAERPSSTVTIYVQGETPESLRRIGTVTLRTHELGHEEARLLRNATAALAAPPTRRSPIAESLAQVIYLHGPAHRRRELILITDLREVSALLGDFECGDLPAADDFVRRMRADGVLRERALRRTAVQVVGLDAAAVDEGRCSWPLSREIELRNLWGAAFRAAGALSVEFSSTAQAEEVTHAPLD